ncbi:DUF3817 domain-containing protein [soil metagenome]
MFKDLIGYVRAVGFIEGCSALVLYFIAMPLQHIWNAIDREIFFAIGMTHGVLFVIYAIIVTAAVLMGKLTWKWWFILAAASIVPFGPFLADRKLKRVEATPSPASP